MGADSSTMMLAPSPIADESAPTREILAPLDVPPHQFELRPELTRRGISSAFTDKLAKEINSEDKTWRGFI